MIAFAIEKVNLKCNHILSEYQKMNTLSGRLLSARLERNWSQSKLAREAGINQSIIALLENGDRKSTTYLPEIAYALGVSAIWLARGRGIRYNQFFDASEDAKKIATAFDAFNQLQKEAVISLFKAFGPLDIGDKKPSLTQKHATLKTKKRNVIFGSSPQ